MADSVDQINPCARTSAPLVFPRDAIVTPKQAMEALQLGEDTYEKADLPTIYFGPHTRRHLWGQVLDALAAKAQ